MTIDFFVHPEWPKSLNVCRFANSMEVYKNYISHMIKILDESEFPILIKSPSRDRYFELRVPERNQFESDIFGKITREQEWEKFTRLLDGHDLDEIRIHGSYFGQCLKNFALQLFVYVKTKENLCRNIPDETKSSLGGDMQYFGDLSNSGIRYGVSLFPPKRSNILRKLIASTNNLKASQEIRPL